MKSSPDLGRADMETFRPGEVPLSIVTTDNLAKIENNIHTHIHTYKLKDKQQQQQQQRNRNKTYCWETVWLSEHLCDCCG